MKKARLPDFVQEAREADAELRAAEEAELGEALAALTQALPPEAAPPGGRRRLVEAARSGVTRWAPFFGRVSALFDVTDERARELLTLADDPARWVAGPLPGVELLHLEGGPRVAQADVGLVRQPAGMHFPAHRHLGDERALLLEGGYRDDQGRLYRPGHLHEMPAGSVHSYDVLRDGPCLIALVLFGGIDLEDVG